MAALIAQNLAPIMFAALVVFLLLGYPVAFALAGLTWRLGGHADVGAITVPPVRAVAPVPDLGLVIIWDDGDDLHAEPRAPYPHARDVLLTRAQLAECGALVGGFTRTGEGQLLLETGWAKEIVAPRPVLRKSSPARCWDGSRSSRTGTSSLCRGRTERSAWSPPGSSSCRARRWRTSTRPAPKPDGIWRR